MNIQKQQLLLLLLLQKPQIIPVKLPKLQSKYNTKSSKILLNALISGVHMQESEMTNNAKSPEKKKKKGMNLKTYPELENSKSLPVLEKIITATSASQRIANS